MTSVQSDSSPASPKQRPDELKFQSIFLAFAPSVAARFEAETGTERGIHVRTSIFIGLAFYNIYQVTNYLLMPDLFWVGMLLRIAVTAASLGLAWLVTRVPGNVRELLITGGMLNAYMISPFLFWCSDDPIALFTFVEMPLSMVFGTMMLVLRFPHTLVFLSCTIVMTATAILMKQGLSDSLKTAFCLQILTSAMLVLYGNYRIERLHRSSFLKALRETMRSERLEVDRQQFAELSARDALTGLANRRHLDEMLAARDVAPLEMRGAMAIMMIDVDHFKLYNDTYGHRVGDECLRQVAAAISAAVRGEHDFAFRYGGEEFAVVLTKFIGTKPDQIASRIRAAIEALKIPHGGRHDGLRFITVSIGGISSPDGDPTPSEMLITQADDALYDAKRRGRNRISLRCPSSSPPDDPSPLARAA